VRRKRRLEHRLLAERHEGLHVVLEHRLVRLALAHRRILRRERLQAILREEKLDLQGLLAPQRAVVVERRDPPGRRHEIRPASLRHACDKVQDRRLRRSRIPRRQWFVHRRSRHLPTRPRP
jgi:hypothetical protein